MDYTIKRGDTLSKIAMQNGTTVTKLAQLNNIKNVDLIQAGKKLTIPTETKPTNVLDAIQQLNEKQETVQNQTVPTAEVVSAKAVEPAKTQITPTAEEVPAKSDEAAKNGESNKLANLATSSGLEVNKSAFLRFMRAYTERGAESILWMNYGKSDRFSLENMRDLKISQDQLLE